MGDITHKSNNDVNTTENASADTTPISMNIDSVDIQDHRDKIPVRQSGVDSNKLKISYQNYKRITNLLVLHMREDEERNYDKEDFDGIKQSELIDW